MPWIRCENCNLNVFTKGKAWQCPECESPIRKDQTEYVPLATSAKAKIGSKPHLIPTQTNPEQPTYLQMQILIEEIREVKELVKILRWVIPISFSILMIYLTWLGVKVNLSPTLFTPYGG